MITSNQPKMRGPGVPLPTKIMVDSHDTKPTNVKNGARLKEIDTGKEFIYNEGTSSWDEQSKEGGGGGGGSSTLSGLTDVDISNPTDGQTLVYNATSGKWENGAGGGGGVVHIIGAQLIDDQKFLTVTAGQLYGWLQNNEYAVLTENIAEVVQFSPISTYDLFDPQYGYAFLFGEYGFVAENAEDYPLAKV